MPEDEVKFCPFLTIVKAGQANYMVCQTNCTFYVDGECVFITTSKMLKELVKPKVVAMSQNSQEDNS